MSTITSKMLAIWQNIEIICKLSYYRGHIHSFQILDVLTDIQNISFYIYI